METLTTLFLILFCILGIFDGLYFHLYKYQLYKYPSAIREHRIHTVRAFVFVPLSMLLFVLNTGGLLLYITLILVAVDLYLELVDILEERESRKPLGGISSEETAIHVFASSFKFASIMLVLVSKNLSAFSIHSPVLLSHFKLSPFTAVGGLFSIGSLVGGILSIALIDRQKIQHLTN